MKTGCRLFTGLWGWVSLAALCAGLAWGEGAGTPTPTPVERRRYGTSQRDPVPAELQRNQNQGQQGNQQGNQARRKGGKNKDPLEDPEYKEKLATNLADVKEMFATAEADFKEQNYREAAALYKSVAMATVPKSEQLAEAARKRLIELEEMAQQHLRAAEDADLAREYLKEVDELTIVVRDFPFTKASTTGLSRLTALKSRKEVAAYVEYAQAEAAEAGGNLAQALKLYQSIAENQRYEGSLPAMKAQRKLDELRKSEATRETLKAQLLAEADKEAPILLGAARNFLLNSLPAQAREKFRTVVEKFPDTKYAEEARQELAKLE